jgi:hypothetical protein
MEKESERRVSILESVLPSTASWQTRSPEVPIADACRGAWSQRPHNKNRCMPAMREFQCGIQRSRMNLLYL